MWPACLKKGQKKNLYILQQFWSPGWPSRRDSTSNKECHHLTGNQAVWMDEGQPTHRRLCGQTTESCFPRLEWWGSGGRRGWGVWGGRVKQHPPTTITPQINRPQPHNLMVDRKGRKLRHNCKKNNNKKTPQTQFHTYSISSTDTLWCMLGMRTTRTDQSQGWNIDFWVSTGWCRPTGLCLTSSCQTAPTTHDGSVPWTVRELSARILDGEWQLREKNGKHLKKIIT